MAEDGPPSGSTTPLAHVTRTPLDADHAPVVSSPLNPDSTRARPSKAPQREQREKKESLKKRENADTRTRGGTPDVKVKKHKGPTVPLPMRYIIPEPKASDYDLPRDQQWQSHEPTPFFSPGGEQELRRPIEHAQNTKAYRYSICVADPYFRHKQWYRSSEVRPFGPHMSIEDSDKWMHLDDSASIITNEKGWRMSRANVFAREGSLYYEVKIKKGVPSEGAEVPPGQEGIPQPHVRMGWARREAPLDAPVGFDGYSYGITDLRFQTMHKSRPGKVRPPSAAAKAKSKSKSKYTQPFPKPEKIEEDNPEQQEDHVRTGDVLGLMITLPSLSLHRKITDGIYNPAVDVGDGYQDTTSIQTTAGGDIIRDRNPVPYRGRLYFEQFEYMPSKPMETYSDRGPYSKLDAEPHPHHEETALRTLPGSSIKVFKNGELVGTAFDNLLAFLPPASAPQNPTAGARTGFDDGTLGYYPAIAAFSGGTAEVNFGPDFWCPPPELQHDAAMDGIEGTEDPAEDKRRPRAIGERYKEQIAEDTVWDIVDEAGFFVQDGGFNYAPEIESSEDSKKQATSTSLKDE